MTAAAVNRSSSPLQRTAREEMLRALRRDLEGLLAIWHRGVNGARARARK